MAKEIKESILVARRELGYPSMKQEQVDVTGHFFKGRMCLLYCQLGLEKACAMHAYLQH